MAAGKGRKPYRNVGGFDQAGDEADYKDLVKQRTASLSQLDTAAATAVSVIYSTYSFPLTTKGDVLGHDGTTIVRKAVGTDYQVLSALASESDGLAWRSLTTTKGDLLGFSTLPVRVPVGANDQVLMADSAQALGVKWASLTTTKGDLLAHDGNDPIRHAVGSDGKTLFSDSSGSTGLSWDYPSAFGLMFGTGEDGNLTLVANTTITNFGINFVLLQYDIVNLDTFNLTQALGGGGDDLWIVMMCRTRLTANGGGITLTPASSGAAGATGSSGSGAGGAGGDSCYAMWVYAREITGTGTLSVNGGTGANGTNATAALSTANGAAGTSGSAALEIGGPSAATTGSATGGGAGQSAGNGGTAGTGTLATTAAARELMKDPMPLFIMPQLQTATTSGGSSADFWRYWRPSVASGGGSGGRNTGAQGGGGGGGAASPATWFANSVAGTAGTPGTAGAAGAGGGGAGAGGAAGLLVVVCYYITSTWTLTANGGQAGTPGTGFGNGGGGGAVGSGPGGWIALAKGPKSQTPTLEVNGGACVSGGNAGNSGRTATYIL